MFIVCDKMLYMRMIGYIRVSTNEQELSVEAQRKRLLYEADVRGWQLRVLIDKGHSGAKPPMQRPALRQALTLMQEGAAQGLVVTKLDRIARSLADVSNMLATSSEQGWNLVALDLGIDTCTPEGQLMAGIMASIAQWERARIRERIIEALAITRANGTTLGAPKRYDNDVAKSVVAMRDEGMQWGAIAMALASVGVTTKANAQLSSSQLRSLYARAMSNE